VAFQRFPVSDDRLARFRFARMIWIGVKRVGHLPRTNLQGRKVSREQG
jgi:hypothetical protein